MNILTSNNQQSISSLQIANLVGTRHSLVKQSIERLVVKGVIAPLQTSIITSTDSMSRKRPVKVYVFSGKQGIASSYVVVAQISPQKIGAMVDVWGKTKTTLNEIILALESFDVPEDMSDMYIYAIQEVQTGHIKLGISRNPAERLKQLQTGNSCDLQLLGFRKAINNYQDERSIHQKASDYHIRGEWFDSDALKLLTAGEGA